MKKTIHSMRSNREGSVLVTAIIMLAIAALTVGSILAATMTYSKQAQASYYREKAVYLADAGLRAALVNLNADFDANISYDQSHDYFTDTSGFTIADWGFQTQVTVVNGRNVLVSNGKYGSQAQIQAETSLGSGSRSIHALYAHALFAGNSSGNTNYVLKVGGVDSGADFVNGDVYSGSNIELTGNAFLRVPEAFVNDVDSDGICDPGTDTWVSAYATQVFTSPLSKAAYDSYKASMQPYTNKVYNNGKYDVGEAFVDTIGNGVYDMGEPFTDSNGNGVRDPGDSFIDQNGNGRYDAGVDTVVDSGNGLYDTGEEWTEDVSHTQRQNGRYDPAGGYYKLSYGLWTWRTSYSGTSCASWPAEAFEDVGDGQYTAGEPYIDQNGVYDVGEEYLDDRNSVYDYGTEAVGTIVGMPAPGLGQRTATGENNPINPPDLVHMYYAVNRNDSQPAGALTRWGNDVAVTASDYGSAKTITDSSRPEHIFVRNPTDRTYTALYSTNGARIDDYFLEDPTDSTYNQNPTANRIAQNDSSRTCTMFINVKSNGNMKVYYVDGNMYIHNPNVYSMRFRQPGTIITIVAKGNITISDEFYYNADYPTNLQYADMNSTVVKNPSDALCLIALKNPKLHQQRERLHR